MVFVNCIVVLVAELEVLVIELYSGLDYRINDFIIESILLIIGL